MSPGPTRGRVRNRIRDLRQAAGLQIFNSQGGFIGLINLPVYPVSCCFGGEDMKTLYMVGYDKVYRISTHVAGLRYPPT